MKFIIRSQKVSLDACIGISLSRTRDIPNLFLTCCRFTSPNEAFCFYNQQVICFFVIAPFLNFVVKLIYNKFKNLNILWLTQKLNLNGNHMITKVYLGRRPGHSTGRPENLVTRTFLKDVPCDDIFPTYFIRWSASRKRQPKSWAESVFTPSA